MPKLSHGTDMVDTTATDTHTDMAATDIATWERDLLMPNQRQKLHHGTDMVDTTVDTTDTHTDTDGYYRGKRSADAEASPVAEADAEAKPWYGYGYAGYPYAYGGYYGYPYSYPYLGKRSADAEPEAEAKPWYGYRGYYGY